MLGEKPWRIDILTRIDGVSFREVWADRVEAEFDAEPLYVIGRKQLLANKRAAGIEKDLRDIALLEAHRPPRTKRAKATIAQTLSSQDLGPSACSPWARPAVAVNED